MPTSSRNVAYIGLWQDHRSNGSRQNQDIYGFGSVDTIEARCGMYRFHILWGPELETLHLICFQHLNICLTTLCTILAIISSTIIEKRARLTINPNWDLNRLIKSNSGTIVFESY